MKKKKTKTQQLIDLAVKYGYSFDTIKKLYTNPKYKTTNKNLALDLTVLNSKDLSMYYKKKGAK